MNDQGLSGTQTLQIPGTCYKYVNLNDHNYSIQAMRQLSYLQTLWFLLLYLFGWRKQAITVLASNVIAQRGHDGLALDTLEFSKPEIRDVFSTLCDESCYPILVHCTQGKDRTGLIVLLTLLLCGVSKEAIRKDYMLSQSELRSEKEEKLIEIRSIGLPESFADCQADWVSTVCEHIDSRLGGVEEYLDGCGLTKEEQSAFKNLFSG